MTEPVTLTVTATAIVGFLFTKVAETLTAKATEAVLPKINKLRQKVLDKLLGIPDAKKEIDKTNKQGEEKPDLEDIAYHLKQAMKQDQQFAKEIQDLVDEINQDLENEGQGKNVMYVSGGKGYQQNQNQGTINNADTINIHHGKNP
jgi:hypothetical protein